VVRDGTEKDGLILGFAVLIYIRIIYRFSGVSNVNPVYGKTLVESDTTRLRDANGYWTSCAMGLIWDWDVWDWD
jgi:hypothetical protein